MRQGDPISPYIFILLMEAFSNVMEDASLMEGFSFHPNRQQLNITHVIFVDDLFLLCGADVSSLQILRTVE